MNPKRSRSLTDVQLGFELREYKMNSASPCSPPRSHQVEFCTGPGPKFSPVYSTVATDFIVRLAKYTKFGQVTYKIESKYKMLRIKTQGDLFQASVEGRCELEIRRENEEGR